MAAWCAHTYGARQSQAARRIRSSRCRGSRPDWLEMYVANGTTFFSSSGCRARVLKSLPAGVPLPKRVNTVRMSSVHCVSGSSWIRGAVGRDAPCAASETVMASHAVRMPRRHEGSAKKVTKFTKDEQVFFLRDLRELRGPNLMSFVTTRAIRFMVVTCRPPVQPRVVLEARPPEAASHPA